jgi:hypothetical protein
MLPPPSPQLIFMACAMLKGVAEKASWLTDVHRVMSSGT